MAKLKKEEMKETAFFFPNGSYNLFGILHEPENGHNGTGFVFCSPFAEEKLWAHRVFVNFARELARLGYTVLRFDYMGHGDSEGDFEYSSIETRLSDIKTAVQELRRRVQSLKNVVLLGLRLGATLASLVAEEESTISHLILWGPITNGASYAKEILRINLSTQAAIYKEIRHNREKLVQMMKAGQTVNVDGYEISGLLYDQISEIDLINGNRAYSGRTLVVQISRKHDKFNNNLETLKKLYENSDMRMAIEDPFWKEIKLVYTEALHLNRVTLEWLGESL